MWGGARLGYAPPPALLAQLQQQALDALRQPHGSPEAFSTQVSSAARGWLAGLSDQRARQSASTPLMILLARAVLNPRPQEACMAAWALAVLQGLTPDLWAAALSFLAACPEDSWDEVRGAGEAGRAAWHMCLAARQQRGLAPCRGCTRA